MADPASFPLNIRLMRNPANWIIVGLMMLFAILAFNIVTDNLPSKKDN